MELEDAMENWKMELDRMRNIERWSWKHWKMELLETLENELLENDIIGKWNLIFLKME